MVASDTTGTVATHVVLVADGAPTFRWSSHFPQNNLSPVEIDWAAKAVDSDIIALVSKSTSEQRTQATVSKEKLRLAALGSQPVQDLLFRRKHIEPQAITWLQRIEEIGLLLVLELLFSRATRPSIVSID